MQTILRLGDRKFMSEDPAAGSRESVQVWGVREDPRAWENDQSITHSAKQG